MLHDPPRHGVKREAPGRRRDEREFTEEAERPDTRAAAERALEQLPGDDGAAAAATRISQSRRRMRSSRRYSAARRKATAVQPASSSSWDLQRVRTASAIRSGAPPEKRATASRLAGSNPHASRYALASSGEKSAISMTRERSPQPPTSRRSPQGRRRFLREASTATTDAGNLDSSSSRATSPSAPSR